MSTFQHESVDPRVLGQRLADARKAKAATQEEIANALGCSRPTYIAIEKGERKVRAEEVLRLAKLLKCTVSELVRPGKAIAEFSPHLRAATARAGVENSDELRAAIESFQKLAEDYFRLEQLVEAPLRRRYGTEIKLGSRVDPLHLAESAAAQERQRLGLGDQPLINLRLLLESEVGARVFFWPLPSHVSGMYAYSDDLGICIMVNQRHPEVRRRASLAHEYGHSFVDRYSPGVDYTEHRGKKPANERFAEAFAMAFLMPTNAVQQNFYETLNSRGDFQVADLVRMSHYFWVSLEAMAIRLESLALLKKGTWRVLSEDRFSRSEAASALGLDDRNAQSQRLPERYIGLAVLAYDGGQTTERELAHYLRCTPIEARRIVAEHKQAAVGDPENGASRLHLDYHRSLMGK